MTTDNIIPIVCIVIASAILAGVLRSRFRYEFIINEGFVGLLYHEGKLTEALLAGRHIRWGRHFRVVPLETRKTLLPVAGQEVLTADNIGVKISLVLTNAGVRSAEKRTGEPIAFSRISTMRPRRRCARLWPASPSMHC